MPTPKSRIPSEVPPPNIGADAVRDYLGPTDVSDTTINTPVTREYFRPNEVVKATGLARSTVWAALARGDLRGYRVGRAWLIPVAEVRRWIEEN